MQLDQTFTVTASPDAVWSAFHDPVLLVACLPGASLRGEAQGNRLPLLFKVKLGPIAAAFAGEGEVHLDEAARTGRFAGQAADPRSNSRVKGEASFAVAPAGEGTQVTVAVTFTITGSLAQFSREGIVRALAEQLTRQFADNLQAELAAEPVSAPAGPVKVTPPDADTAQALGLAAAAGHGAMPWAVDTAVVAPPAPRSSRAAAAPSINLLALLGALCRTYWHKLIGRKAS
ncbi:SRPBCC family protein [Achromobacter sp. GG226]|uniref:SRPBCC family protein n=1 Tax=Verticiella alkaliphila TaxID=2779529 RepID=UPI001C0BDCCC|nr:SRPBCC family protein [Verticiella sp. GG226]MBU4611720.1 SRPBCC family protein [Verticiella sp. GG226]